jgi:hypothetical protein
MLGIRGRGEQLGRSLSIAGAGIVLFFLVFSPHDYWHIIKLSGGWLGVGPAAWTTLFHVLWAFAAFYTAYGFYLAWKFGHER